MQTKQEYLLDIPFEYILGFSIETGLIRRKEYFTKKDFVHRLLRTMNLFECKKINDFYHNNVSYEVAVSEFLYTNPNAAVISKNFVEYLSNTTKNLGTLCFEFPITKTRVDILRLENKTYAYEVKSQRDRIDRLDYQIPALQKVFEHTIIIVPCEIRQRVKKLVHDDVGIISFVSKHGSIDFEVYREPEIANNLDQNNQLKLLRMEELKAIYTQIFGKISKNTSKAKIVHETSSHLDSSEINEIFKLTLRNRSNTPKTCLIQDFF